MPLPWFRLYTEILHDPKLRRVGPDARWVWVGFLCLASDSPERGSLLICEGIPLTVADLAKAIGVEPSLVESAIKTFTGLHMMGRESDGTYTIKNWDGRQFKSDNSTPRVQRYRERQRQRDATVTVTPPEADTDTESDTDTELAATDDQNTESLFRLIDKAGVLISSALHAERWTELLEITTDFRLIEAAFREKAKSSGLPTPGWMRSTLTRCVTQGCMPGEWPNRENIPAPQARVPPAKSKEYTYFDPFLQQTITTGKDAGSTKRPTS